MISVESINLLIDKLKKATEPLSVEKQRNLGSWLEEYIETHDNKLLSDVFLGIEEEAKEEVKNRLLKGLQIKLI